MQHLSQLMRTVNRTLEKRRERQGSRVIDLEDYHAEHTINDSLVLCRGWLEDIYLYFKPLVQKDSGLNRREITARFKFVIKQDYIAAQERKINMHLSTLSVSLTTLLHEDNGDRIEREEAERQERARAQQRQQDVHEAFLQQLFRLFEVVFHTAKAAASPTPSRSSQHRPHSPIMSDHVVSRPLAAITNQDDQQTLQDLFFGPTVNQKDPFRQFQIYQLPSNDAVLVPDTSHLQVAEAALQAEIDNFVTDEQELYRMERSMTVDMTSYANETTFVLAIKRGQSSIVSSLISEGADVTASDIHGWTLLHYAVFYLREEIVDTLLSQPACSNPAFVNAKTLLGETALIFAAQRVSTMEGYNIAVKILGQQECNVNITDGQDGQEGYSALYYTVSQGKPSNKPRRELARLLATKGADVQSVYDIVPERVSYFEFLSSYVEALSDDAPRRDSSASLTKPTERKNSSASLQPRRESTSSLRRFSFFRKRTDSYTATNE